MVISVPCIREILSFLDFANISVNRLSIKFDQANDNEDDTK